MRFVRVGICVLLAFAVLSFGAVEEWAQAALEVGAAFLLIAWAIRQYWFKAEQLTIPPEFLPLGAFALVAAVQLVFHLTASRYYTRMELQLVITYLVVIFLMSQAFTRSGHWRAICMVFNGAGILRIDFWHSAASDVQRETLLVPRHALWRVALRTIRKSEPLCGIR